MQMDVRIGHYPYFADGYVPYPYPPPYVYYPPLNSPGYATSPTIGAPYPVGRYVPKYPAGTSRGRRPRSRSPISDMSHSSGRMEDEAEPKPIHGSTPAPVVGYEAPIADPPPASRPGTTALHASEPQTIPAGPGSAKQAEEEEQPLSKLFRVAPARVDSPQHVCLHTLPMGVVPLVFYGIGMSFTRFFFYSELTCWCMADSNTLWEHCRRKHARGVRAASATLPCERTHLPRLWGRQCHRMAIRGQ